MSRALGGGVSGPGNLPATTTPVPATPAASVTPLDPVSQKYGMDMEGVEVPGVEEVMLPGVPAAEGPRWGPSGSLMSQALSGKRHRGAPDKDAGRALWDWAKSKRRLHSDDFGVP